MTSSAISSQGSTFKIGTATGSTKNISAIALGFPTIITTSSAHGYANGDVVTFAAIVGTTVLNGQTLVVKNKTSTTFAVDYDTTGGTAWSSGGTTTPVTWTTITEIKSFNGFEGTASTLDASNLASAAKEKRPGLIDYGNFSFEMQWNHASAGHQSLLSYQASQAETHFQLTLPDASVATFLGYVMKVPSQGGVDKIVTGTCDIMIDGTVTWA